MKTAPTVWQRAENQLQGPIMSSWQCNFDIVDIAMWTMYTRYRVNIVYIDVLSCLYRRYRRHGDVNDVYRISCQHRLHRCIILLTSSISSTSRYNYRAWEFTSKEAIWLDVTGSWPLQTRRLHSINGHFSTSRWRYLVTVAKQTTTLLNDTV